MCWETTWEVSEIRGGNWTLRCLKVARLHRHVLLTEWHQCEDEWRTGEMILTGETRRTQRKPLSVPLFFIRDCAWTDHAWISSQQSGSYLIMNTNNFHFEDPLVNVFFQENNGCLLWEISKKKKQVRCIQFLLWNVKCTYYVYLSF
jgi:hypothetical protein